MAITVGQLTIPTTGVSPKVASAEGTEDAIEALVQGVVNQLGALAEKNSVNGTDLDDAAVYGAKIADGAATNAKLANAPAQTLKGRLLGTSGPVTDLTPAEVRGLLDVLPSNEAASRAEGRLARNKGADYPLQKRSRNNIVSPASAVLNNLLLDAKVINADPKMYYRVAYQQNKALLDGENAYDWIIEEAPREGFVGTGTSTVIIGYQAAVYGAQQQIAPLDGIQTIVLHAAARPGVRVELTIDPTALPAGNLPISSLTSDKDAWSWVIDPANYMLRLPSADALAYTLTPTGDLAATWQSADTKYRVTLGKNGFNSLPNVKKLETAAPGASVWSTLTSSPSDWLPPLIVSASANGDAAPSNFTGGNHGSNGDASGTVTARNIMHQVRIDGAPASFGDKGGHASRIEIFIVNELMAYNTVTAGRYVVRQTFKVTIRAGAVEVVAKVKAIEACTVSRDYGPQMITDGFQTDALFLGGQYAAPQAFADPLNSGTKADYPTAWAVALRSTNGQLMSWIDRAYGIGAGAYVASTNPLIFKATDPNKKVYHAVVYGASLPLAAAQGYEWRGGYALQAPGLQPTGHHVAANVIRAGQSHDVLAAGGQDWLALPELGWS
ncbi:hypothetical protein [Limimaricola cinnabarinus]|uniref:Uncharacterized protein n=1 Tax=Limimaricola cinnabarinus LL-001 TaxID=1337093 RepID=U3ACV9_9RHOB|nr:hypothetical protein [Limimaricola cinnabarinus]GAD55499.1 hypothetical protein MBELCI_1551 [Limimaricola cinnabarinus LL-001]